MTDTVENSPINAGKLVLVTNTNLRTNHTENFIKFTKEIHGMVHCSGGAQTKILHFVKDLHVIKDNMFDVPPLFKLIQEQSEYRLERNVSSFQYGAPYGDLCACRNRNAIIAISKSYNVDAKIVGRVEAAESNKLTITSEFGEFEY